MGAATYSAGCYDFVSSSGFVFSVSLPEAIYYWKDASPALGAELFFAHEGMPGSAGESSSRLNGLSST